MRAALYARVSTFDQTTENQTGELQQFVAARNWTAAEYVEQGISGTKERRPGLDKLMSDARRRKFDVLVVWRLDRLGRNLKHLLTTIDELQALGIAFVSLHEGIDATTPAGRLQLQLLGAFAEFERNRIAERVKAGIARAKRHGSKFGRPVLAVDLHRANGLAPDAAARALGVSVSTYFRRKRAAVSA